MERTKKKLRLCIALIVANIVIIWGNSLLPGSVSGAISGWLRDVIALLFPGQQDPNAGHGLLRKLAHFTEFACLGGLLSWLLAMLDRPRVLALVDGFLVACADETIQRFVPDRGPRFTDVLIDTSGVLTGIIVVLVGYTVCRNTVWRSQENEKMDSLSADTGHSADSNCMQKEEQ